MALRRRSQVKRKATATILVPDSKGKGFDPPVGNAMRETRCCDASFGRIWCAVFLWGIVLPSSRGSAVMG